MKKAELIKGLVTVKKTIKGDPDRADSLLADILLSLLLEEQESKDDVEVKNIPDLPKLPIFESVILPKRCPICKKVQSVKQDGTFYKHGPKKNRCLGSGKPYKKEK